MRNLSPSSSSSLAVTLLIILCTLSALHSQTPFGDRFDEHLHLKPLIDGKLMMNFQFTTTSARLKRADSEHYELFPNTFAQAVKRYGVHELHLSFTQGRWNYEKWGAPISPAPVGAELSTWFDPAEANATAVEENWRGMVHALSGLFCASLNFLDVKTSPTYAAGVISGEEMSHNFRYGTLSRETVCTENLTPFKKLLPNRSKSGIGVLLNPLKLYDTHFHSMGVHFRQIPTNDEQYVLFELVQTVTVVFDLLRGVTPRMLPSWKLSSVVGLRDNALANLPASVLASTSSIFLEISPEIEQHVRQVTKSQDQTVFTIEPNLPLQKVAFDSGATTYKLDVKNIGRGQNANISFKWIQNNIMVPYETKPLTAITAHRFHTGYGQFEGALVIKITNNIDKPVLVRYYDTIPWYFRVYFHSLRASINTRTIQPDSEFKRFHIVPAKERKTPAIMDFTFVLPAESVLTLMIDFDKVFLKYTEHPPDANRGFDISSSIVSYIPLSESYQEDLAYKSLFDWRSLKASHDNETVHIPNHTRYFTESLLITLPTPDFSMPYNVITFTSTVLSLFIGTVFNILTRKDVDSTKQDTTKEKSKPIATLISKTKEKIVHLVEGDSKEEEEDEEESEQHEKKE